MRGGSELKEKQFKEMAKQKTILIRADSSVAIGTGHVMRCLALAQAWQDAGGRAAFALASAPTNLRQRLLQESCAVTEILAKAGTLEDADETLRLAEEISASWIVVDGYHFGPGYHGALESRDARLLILDDSANVQEHSVDLVLNQNLFAPAGVYAGSGLTPRLLGPDYCLLRREFAARPPSNRHTTPVARHVLVTMGGSDPENVTCLAIQALNLIDDDRLEAAIVLGGSNQNSAAAEALAANCDKKIKIYKDPSNMADLMAWADVALSAAGTTSWELCFMGIPAVLIAVASNQIPIAKELSNRTCAFYAGKAEEVSAEGIARLLSSLLKSEDLRTEISTRGRDLIDGNGARRVVSALLGFDLRLRRAQHSDAELLWHWANDPEVRAASFSSLPIPWETHLQWFAEKMNPECSILIAEDEDGTPVGQVRFDPRSDGDFDIAVSIAKAWRGRGFAASLISKAVRWLFAERDYACIHAYVKMKNATSIKAFERAGFQRIDLVQIKSHEAVHFASPPKSIRGVDVASRSSVAVLQEF